MEILLVKTDDENFYVLKIYLKSQINIFINSNEFLRDRSFGHLREALVHCKKYIPYARHYNPQFVYFLPTF